MATFRYKAINAAGRTVEDGMEANDRKELIAKLKDISLIPFEIAEKKSHSHQLSINFFGGKHVSGRDITQFTAQLSALVNAKMNIAKALKSLARQNGEKGMDLIITSLLNDVNKGKSLSDALEAYPQYFSSLYLNMIRIGEIGGVLDKALQRILEMRQKDEELLGKIKGALAYPCVMALVMLGSVIILLTFVIPKFSGIFSQMGAALPLTTRIVISLSGFLAAWWWLLLVVIIAAFASVRYLLRKDEYKLKFDQFKFSMPLLGRIIKGICISRYSLSMGALLSSGVSMMKALEATVPVSGNFFMETALKQISAEVREGASLSAALHKRENIFPALMTGMVATGEESGSLDEMLNNAGEYFRKEAEGRINTLTTLFEPVMILVMGGIVGFIISAILLPIFNISTSIH